MFKKNKISFPVKEIVEEIKNNLDKFKVQYVDESEAIHVVHCEKRNYSFYIFPSHLQCLCPLFGIDKYQSSDKINWMTDEEKSYIYHQLLDLGKSQARKENDEIRESWGKAFGAK